MRTPHILLRALAFISLLFAGTVIAAAPASAAPQATGVTITSIKVTAAPIAVQPCVEQVKSQVPASFTKQDTANVVAMLCNLKPERDKASHANTSPATAVSAMSVTGFCTSAHDGIPGIANVYIKWCFNSYSAIPSYTSPTSLNCGYSDLGFTTEMNGPCAWYGSIPATGGNEAFGATENFVLSAGYKGISIHASHYLNIATHGNTLSCQSTDEDTAGSCWVP